MDSIPCNLVLVPSLELAAKAIATSQKLAQFGGLFVLEAGKFFPHISMYKFQLNAEDVAKVNEVLATIAQKMPPLQLKTEQYSFGHDGYDFIDVQYEKSAVLLELQQNVVQAVNPIRAGMREKDKERMLSAMGLALEYFQKYGYNLIGELYRPHISLTCLKAESPEAASVLPDLRGFDGSFVGLGLFETGSYGTAIRKLAEPQLFGVQA